MVDFRIKRTSLIPYIALTISFMGGCSVFQGEAGSLQWTFFYYGSYLILLLLSMYYILKNKDPQVKRQRRYFILLFCVPRIIILLYSCVIWIASSTPFPYISRGISNTIFQCIALFSGVCFACGEKDNILKVSFASLLTVFGLSYICGFVQNGFSFIYALNPLSPLADQFRIYTELHELAYILGIYVLVSLIVKKYDSLKKKDILFLLLTVALFIAWKRIGIFALILVYLYYNVFSKCRRTNKSFYVKVTGIIAMLVCLVYVALIVSGMFVEILNKMGIFLSGRDIIYGYFTQFADFSITFFGRGIGFVSRQFDYTTRADLYNMVSVKALHNDLLKMYIDIGFIGYFLWVFWWLIKKPQIIQKRYGVEKAFICLLFIIYTFILYTTDNTEGYLNYQMHLSAVITYFSCFYVKHQNVDRRFLK